MQSRGSRRPAARRSSRSREAETGSTRQSRELGPDALGVAADVSSYDECQRIVEETVDRFGRIDTFCANAMVTVYREARELEPEELRRVLDVNFIGGVQCYWASLPHLVSSRGTFVQVASALSYRGIPLQAAYCSSKAALPHLLRDGARRAPEARDPGRHLGVLPGAINTPQFDMARQYIGKQPMPVPPIYEPEPFAAGVVHCFEHPIRELPLGWGAQKLLWGQKLSPRAGDFVLRAKRLEGAAHGRGQARRLARQPLRAAPRRQGRARQLHGALTRQHALDVAAPAPDPRRDRGHRGRLG